MADEEDMIFTFLNKQREEYSEFLDSDAHSFFETMKPQIEGLEFVVEQVREEQISLIDKLEEDHTVDLTARLKSIQENMLHVKTLLQHVHDQTKVYTTAVNQGPQPPTAVNQGPQPPTAVNQEEQHTPSTPTVNPRQHRPPATSASASGQQQTSAAQQTSALRRGRSETVSGQQQTSAAHQTSALRRGRSATVSGQPSPANTQEPSSVSSRRGGASGRNAGGRASQRGGR